MPVTQPAAPPSDADRAAALINAVGQAEALHVQFHEKIVEAAGEVAALRAEGWTWRRIDQASGVAPSTALRWMKAFAAGDDRTGYVPVGRAVPEPES